MVMIPMAAAAAVEFEPAESVQLSAASQPSFSIFPQEDGVASEAAVEIEITPETVAVEVPAELVANAVGDAAITAQAAAVALSEVSQVSPTAPPTREQLLRRAEDRLIEIALEQAELTERIDADKARLKELKDEHAEAAVKLRDLREGRDVQMKLPVCAACGRPADPCGHVNERPAGADGVGSPTEIASVLDGDPPPAALPPEPNAWREVPITDLDLSSLKGLGKKKREALLDAAPTIGALEDLRVKAGPMGLHTELPKGFGEKIASDLEELVIRWLAENRDRQLFAHDKLVAIADRCDPPPDATSELDALKGRHAELLAMDDWPAAKFGEIYEDGRRAAQNGWPITECNWTDPDKIDSWLLGHIIESSKDDTDADHQGEPADTEAEPAEA